MTALSLYHLKVSVGQPGETLRETATVGVVTATRTDAAKAVCDRLIADGYTLPVVKHIERVCAGPAEWSPGVPCVYGVTQ